VKTLVMFGGGLGWRSESHNGGSGHYWVPTNIVARMAVLLSISDRKLHCDLSLYELICSKCFTAIVLIVLQSSSEYDIALSSNKSLLNFSNICKVFATFASSMRPC